MTAWLCGPDYCLPFASQFSRISPVKATEFCKLIGVHTRTKCSDLTPEECEKLFKEFQEAKLPSPPTDCLAPIGVRQSWPRGQPRP